MVSYGSTLARRACLRHNHWLECLPPPSLSCCPSLLPLLHASRSSSSESSSSCQHTAFIMARAGLTTRIVPYQRQRLRSASTAALDVPVTRRSTMGDRFFSVAAVRVWNSLPAVVTSAPSLLAFRRLLKTELFCRGFPTTNFCFSFLGLC